MLLKTMMRMVIVSHHDVDADDDIEHHDGDGDELFVQECSRERSLASGGEPWSFLSHKLWALNAIIIFLFSKDCPHEIVFS